MKKRKLALLFTVIALALVISIGLFRFYPTRDKVMNSGNYEITQSELDETIRFSISPKSYMSLERGKGTTVNMTLYEDHGTRIFFESIIHRGATYIVNVNCTTNWNFMSGTFLTPWRLKSVDGEDMWSIVSPGGRVYNENNEDLNVIRGKGVSDLLYYEFNETDFLNSDRITIEISGYYLSNYKFNFR